MCMKIIIENKEITYIKEKSKFIGMVFRVETEDEINTILSNLKEKYYDATHICYAMILPNKIKYFDDGEPSGTAGLPILEVLEKNELNYCLGVVIRYFGGIKLGANGLVRAYTKAISNAISNNTKDIEHGFLIYIEEDYTKKRNLDYLLRNAKKVKEQYDDKIKMHVIVNKKTLDNLSSIHYQIIEEKIF